MLHRPTVILTAKFDPELREELHALARVREIPWPDGRCWDRAETVAQLSNGEILITEETDPVASIDSEVLRQCPSLRVVIAAKRQPDVDLAAATERGVLVVRMPGLNAGAVADLTVALILACARQLLPAAQSVHDGAWAKSSEPYFYRRFMGHGLSGKVAGLIGLGAVGQEVASRLVGFRMRVLACDPGLPATAIAAAGCEPVDLYTILRESDFVSLHASLTPESTGVLGREEFAPMKHSAYLINTARAALVDEAALLAALTTGQIAGAGLDVFHQEPMSAETPLARLPSVIMTPHIGGAVFDQTDEQSRLALSALRSLAQGVCPANALNPEVFPVFGR